ncbi:ubiquitin-conjugating enzyme family protein [Cryptosporidium andersoni]|uniref:Ubiquitin-conjugating enzyme family protein n=1 Tax=Cryptosporidium andersoni TaxID=117008 RepID=A0A1J4MW37_9CRYT|nr:ubiquitin-conjugating enzyme family protein [Cryptosporidium andersoni]
MSSCRNRLIIEAREAQKYSDSDIKLGPRDDNLHEWVAKIIGPIGSPYENGVFELNFKIPPQYPLFPPSVIFVTPLFHPNVNFQTGELCLDVIKNNWSPAWTLQSVCRAITALLHDPNAESPLNCDAGNIIRSGDMKAFNNMAKMYVIEYAQEK